MARVKADKAREALKAKGVDVDHPANILEETAQDEDLLF